MNLPCIQRMISITSNLSGVRRLGGKSAERLEPLVHSIYIPVTWDPVTGDVSCSPCPFIFAFF